VAGWPRRIHKPGAAAALSDKREDEDENLRRVGSTRKRRAYPPADRHPGVASTIRLFAGGSRVNRMRGGHVQRVLRRRWGEDPGEDEAQERIGRQAPSPVPGASTDSLEDQTPEGGGFGLTSGGDASREASGFQRGKASEGWKPQERYRGETNPSGSRREQGVERLRKPVGATRWARQAHHQVALRVPHALKGKESSGQRPRRAAPNLGWGSAQSG
jgi:hypothetical protein